MNDLPEQMMMRMILRMARLRCVQYLSTCCQCDEDYGGASSVVLSYDEEGKDMSLELMVALLFKCPRHWSEMVDR